jgi:hypothetical protein
MAQKRRKGPRPSGFEPLKTASGYYKKAFHLPLARVLGMVHCVWSKQEQEQTL